MHESVEIRLNYLQKNSSLDFREQFKNKKCPGDDSVVELPNPIPNLEVKGGSGDDSTGATPRENTTLPGHFNHTRFLYVSLPTFLS